MSPQEFSEDFPFLTPRFKVIDNSKVFSVGRSSEPQTHQPALPTATWTVTAGAWHKGTTLARGYPSDPLRQILSGRVCPSKSEKGRKKLSGLLTTKEKSPNLWADSSHNSLHFWKRNQTKRPHPLTKSREQWKLSKNSPHVRTKNAPFYTSKKAQSRARAEEAVRHCFCLTRLPGPSPSQKLPGALDDTEFQQPKMGMEEERKFMAGLSQHK